jgi:hypothetical protein
MDDKGHAQLYVRFTTQHFERAMRARKERWGPSTATDASALGQAARRAIAAARAPGRVE